MNLFSKENQITEIETSNGAITEICTVDKKIQVENTDIVVSSLPIVSLIRMLGHSTKLKYRGVMIFYLDCMKKRILPKKLRVSLRKLNLNQMGIS